jgi:hypothetical protein
VRFGGVLEWRPRPTNGCSAIEEEEEEEDDLLLLRLLHVSTLMCHL